MFWPTYCLTISILFHLSSYVSVDASAGDRSYIYQSCLHHCQQINCSTSLGLKQFQKQQTFVEYLFQWSCPDECAYQCMWKTVHQMQADGQPVVQFHGNRWFSGWGGTFIHYWLQGNGHSNVFWVFKNRHRPCFRSWTLCLITSLVTKYFVAIWSTPFIVSIRCGCCSASFPWTLGSGRLSFIPEINRWQRSSTTSELFPWFSLSLPVVWFVSVIERNTNASVYCPSSFWVVSFSITPTIYCLWKWISATIWQWISSSVYWMWSAGWYGVRWASLRAESTCGNVPCPWH